MQLKKLDIRCQLDYKPSDVLGVMFRHMAQ
jgi:hypothetical protein